MNFRAAIFLLLFSFLFACSHQKDPSLPEIELLEKQITEVLVNDGLSNSSKNDSLQTLINEINQDSVKNSMIFKISYHFYKEDDSLLFRNWHHKSRILSLKLGDSLRIAESYWDMGNFLLKHEVLDSSYFNYNRAYNIYLQNSEPVFAGRMLTNMAIIEGDIRDYTRSEITSTKALKLLKNSNRYKTIYSNYNNLGITYKELEEFHKALEHHRMAMELIERLDGDREDLKATSLNNIGVVYQGMERHEKAIKTFDEAMLSKDLHLKEPRLFAMLLDNKAYSRLKLGDTIDVRNQMERALFIRDSIGHKAGIVMNKIHLSEFFTYRGDTISAINLLSESLDLAKETENFRDVLQALWELSALDDENADKYLREYITLSKRLQSEDRTIRNKFTKIKFETDHFIAENQKLYNQRDVLVGLSFGIALLGLSGLFIINQRSKNRVLLSKQREQEAIEKIYQLILDQQNLKEEGRQKERGRISKELHDGILAKLFGLRLSLSSLNNGKDQTSIAQRETYLEDLKNLEVEIRQLSHELNSSLFTSSTSYNSVLEDVIHKYHESYIYKFSVDEKIDWDNFSGSVKVHLLRILQEAIKNILEHSEAKHVAVNIEVQQEELIMTIKDDGVGFESQEKNGGIGLKNMKSRVKEMGGSFKIRSAQKGGTRIAVHIPI